MWKTVPNTAARPLARLAGCRRGANAVEFAIIAPFLLFIVAGILVYGLYFGTAHAVQQLAADAARASIAGLSDDERTSLAQSHVAESAGGYLLIRPENVRVNAVPSGEGGDLFVVTIDYNASDLPVFGLEGLIPVPAATIRRSSTIRRGGY